ncbi:hypothetical protein WJX73_004117 [Symbiochloris irregularis]|uniref:Uncharacterized protein n=1 Tax=Symbiochloris irregularis TaxID=706552 RepID=A0AAW1P145_9CHLO
MSFTKAGNHSVRPGSPPRQPATLKSSSPRSATVAEREKQRQRRERIYYLLKEHAGEHAVEARQTPWLMQLINALDDMVQEQLTRSQLDQEDLMDSLNSSLAQASALEQKLETLQCHTAALEQQKAVAEAALAECREALDAAQAAAKDAGCSCSTLQEAVDVIAREDFQARRQLSLRTHALKENLAAAHRLLHEQRRLVCQQDSQLAVLQREIQEYTPPPPVSQTRCKHPLHKRMQGTDNGAAASVIGKAARPSTGKGAGAIANSAATVGLKSDPTLSKSIGSPAYVRTPIAPLF